MSLSLLAPTGAVHRIELVRGAAGLVHGPVSRDAARLAGAEELACTLGWRARRGEVTAPGASQARAWERAYVTTAARNAFMEHAVAPLEKATRRVGIDLVPLKGLAMIRDVYRDPGARTMGDIDLLVVPSRFDEAVALMSALGAAPAWPRPDRPVTRTRYHELPLWLEGGLLVDLHRGLVHPTLFSPPDADWPPVPSSEAHLIHAAIHAAIDGYLVKLRAVVDGLLLAAVADPEGTVAMARRWSAMGVLERWLTILHAFAPLPSPWPDLICLGGSASRLYRPRSSLPSGWRGALYTKLHILGAPDSRRRAAAYAADSVTRYCGDRLTALSGRLGRKGITFEAPAAEPPVYSGTS